MDSNQQKTAIIYCRVSSPDQVDNTSLESQEKYCREYAKKNDLKVLEIFIELGESAKTINRTEFTKAIAYCGDKKHRVDCFLVYKLDRFARNQDDHVTVRAILRRTNTELRSATEPINDTPVGRAMEGMISVFAEFDNNVRTERTKSGMRERVRQGVWCWAAPLGYYRPTGLNNIAPDPKIAPYILLAFEEYAKGIYTYKTLSDYLYQRGLKSSKGKVFYPQLLEKILKNPIYCGIINVWGERVQGKFESIVPEELFLRCQKGYRKKSEHAAPRSANNPLFPLRRMVVCSHCQQSITGSSSRGQQGKYYSYYHHYHPGCLKANTIPKETLEQLFVEYLNEITPSAKYEKLFKAIVLDIWQNNYKELDHFNNKIKNEIATLENERQRIFDLHRASKYTDEEFIEQKRIINEKIDQKRLLLQDKWAEEYNMEEALNHCFSLVRNTAKVWQNADYERRLRFQKLVFNDQSVEFDGKNFGTTNLSLIYKLKETPLTEKSLLVTPWRIELQLQG